MTALDFNDRGRAFVSFDEFNNYMNERLEEGDYTKEKDVMMVDTRTSNI